jgi:K+-sensing histidine kinase KdpD
MAATITSGSSSQLDSIGRPGLRLVANRLAHLATVPVCDNSPKTAVLACITPGSLNRELLRKASIAARDQNGELYAAIVSPLTRFAKTELRALVDDAVFATQLRAKILWLDSPDEVAELLQLANQFRIGRIFVLRQRATRWSWPFGGTLCSGLLSRAKRIRVDVVGFERGN